jgi:hypothetical protein
MILYSVGFVLAVASLAFGSMTAFVIALLVTSLAMLDEQDRK